MSEAQKEAREEAERRWPDWVCPPLDEAPAEPAVTDEMVERRLREQATNQQDRSTT